MTSLVIKIVKLRFSLSPWVFQKKLRGMTILSILYRFLMRLSPPLRSDQCTGRGRSLPTVFWRVGGGSGVFPRKLPAPGGGSPRPNPHPALRAPLPIKWGGEKHRIYNDIGNRVTLPPVIFYSPMGKGGGWGFPCKTLRKFTDFQQPIGAVPGSPPPLIWFRRAGPRHRPIRGRCRPARRDANPARRHRPAHRDGVAGRRSCPPERSPGPASRCAPAPPPAR